MADIPIPKSLRDVFGDVQSPWALGLIAVVGLGIAASVACAGFTELISVAWWRATIAVVLIADVCCGAIANFTRGTDRYYATRPGHRWIFIAIHWHLPVIALLIGTGWWFAFAATVYTLAAASVVNLLRGSPLQPPVGAALLTVALAGLSLAATSTPVPELLVTTGALFAVKVIYGFAVTHFPEPDRNR